jgi:Fe-S-cluster containining protein
MKNSDFILIAIFKDIDYRVNAITKEQPAWPCHQGCDLCCRRLPFLPEVSQAEWNLLYEGFQLLPIAIRDTVRQRVVDNNQQGAHNGFIKCPFLNRVKGECLVYAYRPAACRMYGFYVTRSGNRWCKIVQEKYEDGFAEGIVMGNQQAIERGLAKNLGESQSIAVWFDEMEDGI